MRRFSSWHEQVARLFRKPLPRRRSGGTAIESLEVRILPTVTATVSKGELRLTGDAGPNDVVITKTGTGIQVAGQHGTTIKVAGSESTAATFSGVTSLRMSLKGSNDTVSIGDGLTFKNVTLALGAGTNLVAIGSSQVTGKLSVTGGAGADTIQLTRTVLGNATLTTGSGDDRVTFGAVSATGIVTVNTGNGADLVETRLVTPTGGGGEGDGGGGIGGIGGIGNLTLLNNLVQFIETETERNLGDIVNIEQLQEFVDRNGLIDLTPILELAEQIDLDEILNPNGTLNLLELLRLGDLIDLTGLDTSLLQELTQIVDLGDLSDSELALLQELINFAFEFDLDDLFNPEDLADPSQPQGLGSSMTATLNINTGNGDDVVSLANARFGTVSILTGNHRDQVLLNTVAVDKTLKVNAGSGDDVIRANGVQQNGPGNNLIDGSSGIDLVSLTTSLFTSGVTVSGGSTAGNQIVIDDVLFKSFATVNALGIGDLVKIEQDPLRPGSTVFTQAAKFTLGGAAEVLVSQNHPTTSTRFLSTVSLTGKSPRGRLKVAIDRTEFKSPVSLKNVDYSVT